MFNWLKGHFVPHEGNNHRPYFFRAYNSRQLVAIVLMFELMLFVFPALDFTGFLDSLNLAAVLPGTLSVLTNEEREQYHLPELMESAELDRVAELKAEDMATKGYFAHTSPEGKSPWYWFDEVGYQYSYAGENLAVNFVDSQDVTEAWMNSPTHRANIVAAGYTEVGTGVAIGTYQGYKTVFVAQVYGRPATYLAEDSPAAIKLALPKSPSFWQKILSSPRQTTNAVLYTILSIVFLALLLNLTIKIEEHHADLIANGLVVAAIILALQLGNLYLSHSQFQTSFIAFQSPQTLVPLEMQQGVN